jgi:hypothetical protein
MIFVVASVLSGLDVVRIEVDVQKVLQGLRIGKKNTGMCVDLGLGGSAMRLDVHTTAEDPRRDRSGLQPEQSSYGVFI